MVERDVRHRSTPRRIAALALALGCAWPAQASVFGLDALLALPLEALLRLEVDPRPREGRPPTAGVAERRHAR